jgi:hypothetical protein
VTLARQLILAALALAIFSSPAISQVPAQHQTQNIIFVMTDGLRWQEVFDGAEASLMNKKNGGVPDEAELRRTYWRDTPQAQ